MPAALLTCLLTPLGLGEWSLWIFSNSLNLLIKISSTVSSWPGAHMSIAHPPLLSFTLIVFGGLWLCLWQQPWRKWGIFPLCLGCTLIWWTDPPHILVDGQGKMAALYENGILHLSSNRKGKFTAETWAKHLSAQETKLMNCSEDVCKASFQNIPVVVSYEKENQPCLKAAILIRFEPSQAACPEAQLTLDWYDLWRGGSHAIWLTPQGPRLEKVQSQGKRPWTQRSIPRKERPTQKTAL